MFVIRLLLATLAIIMTTLFLGGAMGFSAWQSVGLAFIAAALLQVLVLGYVILAATGGLRLPPAPSRKPALHKTQGQLPVLPK